jgi:hypothetical protein
MRGLPLGRVGNDIFLLLLVMWVFPLLFQGIGRNPKDRVFLFEALALVSFTLAGRFIYFGHPAVRFAVCLFTPFVVFTALAEYFAAVNWLHRKKRAA